MSKIRVLPEHLANQIAAGEVVERPASVVKELLENSLDAGASQVEVEIDGGGTRSIRIIDNGEGMDSDDILLCLERHGTSKIRSQEDLGAICSLGFRGEALPSIGSVSQMSITSKTPDADFGYHVELSYGKLTKSHEMGCPRGTTIEIRNLFSNVPARKKFLRTARTEQNHIDEVIRNYALAAPHVAFVLRVDGRQTLHFHGGLDLSQRLRRIIRQEVALLPVDFARDETHFITGFLVPPEKVSPGPARLRLFVNGRAVRDRMFVHAVAEGMRGFLMKGHNPAGMLSLHLPAEEIDVNVHPAKHEIRFRLGKEVHSLIHQAVYGTIKAAQATLQKSIFGGGNNPQRAVPVRQEQEVQQSAPAPAKPLFHREPVARTYPQVEEYGVPQIAEEQVLTVPKQPVVAPQPAITEGDGCGERSDGAADEVAPVAGVELEFEVLGQLKDLYIFCKTSEGIAVVDQHAAHERLLYEKLKKQYMDRSMVKQHLLFPETVELTLYQAQLVEKYLEELDRMGFALREFGGTSYVISAVPALAGQLAPQKIFFDLLEQFGAESRSRKDAGDILDTILATMACRAAIKAGRKLELVEMESLLADMAAADLFSHCPHGRPVVKQFSLNEIEKWFCRP